MLRIRVGYRCGVSFASAGAARVALMLSTPHEVLVEMFRDRPLLAADLLSGPLGVPVPAFQHARVSSGDLTNVTPTEYRADAVIILTREEVPVLGVVVEVQLRPERRKRFAWPATWRLCMPGWSARCSCSWYEAVRKPLVCLEAPEFEPAVGEAVVEGLEAADSEDDVIEPVG